MASEHPGSGARSVVVVGSGAAGLVAGLEAYRAGARVCVIEKENRLGGNSAKATSGINGAETKAQAHEHVGDSVERFVADIIKSGGGKADPALAMQLGAGSSGALAVLEDLGVDMSILSQCGGHTAPRTHRPAVVPGKKPVNLGIEIIAAFQQFFNRPEVKSMVTIKSNSRVTQLIHEGGAVKGVCIEIAGDKDSAGSCCSEEIRADSVILATGGFSASKELLKRFTPHLAHLPTTNGPFALGEGILLGESVGACLRMMDVVQIHPTGFVDPKDVDSQAKWLAPEAFRASGGLLLGVDGRRFVNELSYRDVVTAAIFKHGKVLKLPDGRDGNTVAHLILNDAACEKFPIAGIYKLKGFVQTFANASELAEHIDVEPQVIWETLVAYNEAAAGGVDPFGKVTFPTPVGTTETLHHMLVTPSLHYTIGGLAINSDAQVLNNQGEIIPGLYAAGEVTGGVHGANRLAGNGLLDNLVFGRQAGTHAGSAPSAQRG
mmetsp:Transcript_21620/g.50896  ORF Transcript_21620/g.50896 Transcript_21620/m.50896 type:complete len:491 (+) Transcript_21620:121-1593(+)|eukprot:CAMPEP_0114548972 /NCGR_PEP_ID=MMETSP0114-20121206/5274_1 /TAXON_ID=31324 /ORGANISM="Goniomonas sp, Strain m" /LENGTH=490 /DNA_ID=CAMNT_0001733613 /DNA_START=105 /DNA_END=1577 /DNA_ORIENTATION=+